MKVTIGPQREKFDVNSAPRNVWLIRNGNPSALVLITDAQGPKNAIYVYLFSYDAPRFRTLSSGILVGEELTVLKGSLTFEQ